VATNQQQEAAMTREQPNRRDDVPLSASSDETIARLVVDELYWDPRVDAAKVQVAVADGTVTLTGHVPTVADKYSAEADARMIRGVVSVRNQIAIDPLHVVPDGELRSNVATILDWNPEIDTSDVEVVSREGVVTLKGTVKSYWEKLRAHLSAARVPGVVRVVDEIAVVPSQSYTDQQIADALTRTLERRLGEDISSIQVTVNNGSVTLRGSVTNAAALRSAQEVAEHTSGVAHVRNELTFPHSPSFTSPGPS
jgi:osmotically-inducible protein OsmY